MEALFDLVYDLPLWARQGYVLFGVSVVMAMLALREGRRA